MRTETLNGNIENSQENQGTGSSLENIYNISKRYLESTENKIGSFFDKHFGDKRNYDGNLEGNTTNSEKVYSQKVKDIQSRLSEESDALRKNEIITSLTQELLISRTQDIGEAFSNVMSIDNSLVREFNQEVSSELREENMSLHEDLLNELDNTSQISESVDNSRELLANLVSQVDSLVGRLENGEINEDDFTSAIEQIANEAIENGLEEEFTRGVGEIFELAMRSGLPPLALMGIYRVRRFLPLLPSAIGVSVWARFWYGDAREKFTAVGETALYIAPISGTIMTGRDAYNSFREGDIAGGVADTIGAVVSLGFDVFTIAAAMTGVGAPVSVGSNALRVAAVQSIKAGGRRLGSVFGRRVAQETSGVVQEGFLRTTGQFFAQRYRNITTSYSELGAREFLKRSGQQIVYDGSIGVWNTLTLKGIRDSRLGNKIPAPFRIFEKGENLTRGARANIALKLENVGIIRRGTADDIRNIGTASELRLMHHETMRGTNDDISAIRIEEMKYNHSIDADSINIREVIRSGSSVEFREALRLISSNNRSNYNDGINVFKNIGENTLYGERLKVFNQEFLSYLRTAESHGVNRYQTELENLLSSNKNNINIDILRNTDFSLLKNVEPQSNIIKRISDALANKDVSANDKFAIIKRVAYYEDISKQLDLNNTQLTNLYNTFKGSNTRLLELRKIIDTQANNNTQLINEIDNTVLNNIKQNDEIANMTPSQINRLLIITRNTSNRNKILEEVIDKKFPPNRNATDKEADKIDRVNSFIRENTESFEVASIVYRRFQGNESNRNTLIEKILKSSENHGVEFKIRFLEDTGLINDKKSILTFLNGLDIQKNHSHILQKIDFLDYKLNGENGILSRFPNLENNNIVSNLNNIILQNNTTTDSFSRTLDILKRDNANFSDRYIEDLKRSGDITYKTLTELQSFAINKAETDNIHKTITQVRKALNNYEMNLFNPHEYQLFKSNDISEKINYVYRVIDDSMGNKLSRGGAPERIHRETIKQLSTLKSNFSLEQNTIHGVVERIISQTNLEGFNIEQKVHLLRVLERTGIINGSVEFRLDFIKAMQTSSDDLRSNVHILRDYTANLGRDIQARNNAVARLRQEYSGEELNTRLKNHVMSSLNQRSPISKDYINDNPRLREWRDYVKVDDKYYMLEVHPYRSFIRSFRNAENLEVKKAYMELIYDKNDFGDRSFRQHFDEVTDIETKILMTYHESIKYDTDVISFLRNHMDSHPELVAYALYKRRDLNLLLENGTFGETRLLEERLTRESLETIEGRRLTDQEYNTKKEYYLSISNNIRELHSILIAAGIVSRELENSVIRHINIDRGIIQIGNETFNLNNQAIDQISGLITRMGISAGEFAQIDFSIIHEAQASAEMLNNMNISDYLRIFSHSINGHRSDEDDSRALRNETTQRRQNIDETRRQNPEIRNFPTNTPTRALIQQTYNNILHNEPLARLGGIDITPAKLIGLGLTLRLLTPNEAMAMDYDIKYDIEDSWEEHPNRAEYERLLEQNRLEEAQALQRQTIIEITRLEVQEFMREQERRLDAYVMEKIDEAIENTRGFNLPPDKKELFRQQYKHELYNFLIEYSNRNDNALHRMYSNLGNRISSGEQFYQQIHSYTTNNSGMLMRNLEQIADTTMDEIFTNEEKKEYNIAIIDFTVILLRSLSGN